MPVETATNPLTIPEWVNPLASADELNQQNDLPSTIRNVIAKDKPVPIVIGAGQPEGLIFALDYTGTT